MVIPIFGRCVDGGGFKHALKQVQIWLYIMGWYQV